MSYIKNRFCWPIVLIFMVLGSFPLLAQDTEEQDLEFKFEPSSLKLNIGETAKVKIQLLDKSGNLQDYQFFLFARGETRRDRRAVTVSPRTGEGSVEAEVTANNSGSFTLTARAVTPESGRRGRGGPQGSIAIEVPMPPLDKITFVNPVERVYVGTSWAFKTKVFDKAGIQRSDVPSLDRHGLMTMTGVRATLTSSNPDVASIDRYGNMIAHKPGKVTVTAKAENVTSRLNIDVVPNPVTRVTLSSDKQEARTGDVIHFEATAYNSRGDVVADAPVEYSFIVRPDDNLGAPASGQIKPDGRFVAETPGLYTVQARMGTNLGQLTVDISPRNVRQEIEVVGHGGVPKVFTSDLWVWEGVDGRDYAVTGTWAANGETYFYDVTDPSKITLIDTVTVDARTVNDVKVSEDGRIAVISREGASNRRNGIVVLDVTNPYNVKIHSRFDDELTGGVHNVFIYKDHVYAVNNGRRFDIINIEDPTKPYRVGRYELDTPGHSIHDVWVMDGIAYSSNWSDGVHLVDVGSAEAGGPFKKYEEVPMPEIQSPFFAGGSPSNPVGFGNYEYPSGWNHDAFPYYSQSTGRFYVIAGDEYFPYGMGARDGEPTVAGGWLHFIDFTDVKNPEEVARFQIPGTGPHNTWVEGDILYSAYFNGGVRVVDISGELMGNLYRQGREIASFVPEHPEGIVANSAFVWGPMPHKGIIYISDLHSGLWAVRLLPKQNQNM